MTGYVEEADGVRHCWGVLKGTGSQKAPVVARLFENFPLNEKMRSLEMTRYKSLLVNLSVNETHSRWGVMGLKDLFE